MTSSMGRMTSHISGENKIHVWNHQPDYVLVFLCNPFPPGIGKKKEFFDRQKPTNDSGVHPNDPDDPQRPGQHIKTSRTHGFP